MRTPFAVPVRALSLALAIVALPLASGAQQRAPRALSVGIGGGGTVPVGDFANDVKTGWNGLAFFQYQPAGEGPWAVRAEAQYSNFKYTDAAIAAENGSPDDEWSTGVLYAGVSAPYFLAGRFGGMRPYVLGGVGLYSESVKRTEANGTSSSTSDTGFGFNGGAGIRVGGSVGFFIEARFHQFSITPNGSERLTGQFIPITVGLNF